MSYAMFDVKGGNENITRSEWKYEIEIWKSVVCIQFETMTSMFAESDLEEYI